MHTLLAFASFLLVLGGSYLSLRHLDGWSGRRQAQCLILTMPIVGLVLGIVEWHHFIGQVCFTRAPRWDELLGTLVPLLIGIAALGGFGLGLLRHALLTATMARSSVPTGQELQEISNRLAKGLGISAPRVFLTGSTRPAAFTYGLWQPRVLLSTWMVTHLDRGELEAVLAHELAHVARHDYLVLWLATMLRDAFFYLPTSQATYRQLQQEKELACDELAVRVTRLPLGLASALVKVWRHALSRSALDIGQTLVQPGELIEGRIERLLAPARVIESTGSSLHTARGATLTTVIGLLFLEAALLTLVLTQMGCSPAVLFGKLF